jgi:hypothetical protein
MNKLYQHLGANIIKVANGIILQKDHESFLVFFHFFVWKNFWMKSFATCY